MSLSSAVSARLPSSLQNDLAPWSQWLNWQSQTRLYRLEAVGANPLIDELMVERFVLHDELSQPLSLRVQVLALRADIPLKQLLGTAVRLCTTLADGQTSVRSGVITGAQALDADGGFARYGLHIQAWPALLNHTLASRVWQQRSVIDIVDDVFADHTAIAAWRWDDEVPTHVRQGLFQAQDGLRPYCVQYRETDLAFVQRLLAEEGIGWRVEESDEAPGGHTVVLFSRSSAQPEDPGSATPLGGPGIRYHQGQSQEAQDSIQALGAVRQLGPTHTVVLGWDSAAQQATHADVPTHHDWGGAEASHLQSWLSSYDPHHSLSALGANALACATSLQEAREAGYKRWLGRGTVRTLRAGTWAQITQSTLSGPVEHQQFLFTQVQALGINNLPKDLSDTLAATFGDDLLDDIPDELTPVLERARTMGYACAFQALRRDVPWRPVLLDDTGTRPRPRPTAQGLQTAIVVGPDGQPHAQGAEELHTDGQGRVKVRFHWQANPYAPPQRAQSDHSCWLRVAQGHSGAGMGQQFIPRIGQEVLVGFLNNDMDLPYVQASLYNGQGEAGIARTPGGQAANAADLDTSATAQSTDHRPSAQGNRIASGTGGHSPAWHGGSPGAALPDQAGQNNAAALSGVKSKEFGGQGANQLVLDDTPNQGRVHLHSSQHQTWLSMGHLLHQADNHRGSFRGLGFELRTDAWGGLRAVRGVMLSTYGLRNGTGAGQGQTPEGAGDNAAGIALARQMQQLASTFDQAARTHQTVGVSAAQGSAGRNQSMLDDTLAPAAALTKSLSGMVSTDSLQAAQADAANKATATGAKAIPHMADPNLALMGKAGIGLTAGQDLILSSGDTTTLASGDDTHWAIGGQARIHTGQAIGLLAGAIQPGSEAAGKGLSLIAAQGPIDLQAQAGGAQVAAKQTLELKTASGVVNLAAAKKVVLAVSGGASITIEGGQLTVQCPGTLTVKAGKKSMVGPGTFTTSFPTWGKSDFKLPCAEAAAAHNSAFVKLS